MSGCHLPDNCSSANLTGPDRQTGQLQVLPSAPTTAAILSLSVLALTCCLLLLCLHWARAGRSAAFQLLRCLCLSDVLLALYGLFKMTMLLWLDRLQVNFFLPESLFFTATVASTISLVCLNLDCFIKLTRPHQYTQVDKETVMTSMLLMWNTAFIVGFLPLMGWNQQDKSQLFFSFFPWPYLFLQGCLQLVAAGLCSFCILSLRRYREHAQLDFGCFSLRMLEVRKYQHLQQTIALESLVCLLCYLPFYMYLALTCTQCPLSDYAYRDSAILYFIPLFMLKSLASSCLQILRTFHGCSLLKRLVTKLSLRETLRLGGHQRRSQPKQAGVSAISYTNPLCDSQRMPDHAGLLLRHSLGQIELTELLSDPDRYFRLSESSHSLAQFNTSFRPSLDLGQSGAWQHNSAL